MEEKQRTELQLKQRWVNFQIRQEMKKWRKYKVSLIKQRGRG